MTLSSGRAGVRSNVAIMPMKASLIVAPVWITMSTYRDALQDFQKQKVCPYIRQNGSAISGVKECDICKTEKYVSWAAKRASVL